MNWPQRLNTKTTELKGIFQGNLFSYYQYNGIIIFCCNSAAFINVDYCHDIKFQGFTNHELSTLVLRFLLRLFGKQVDELAQSWTMPSNLLSNILHYFWITGFRVITTHYIHLNIYQELDYYTLHMF